MKNPEGTDEPPESPWKDPLEKFDICPDVNYRGKTNPCEFLIVRCHNCRAFGSGRRLDLQQDGWCLFIETRIEDHDGFPVCPRCSDGEYSWEDLY